MDDFPSSETFPLILQLVAAGHVKVSDHGYGELAADDLTVRECLSGRSETGLSWKTILRI